MDYREKVKKRLIAKLKVAVKIYNKALTKGLTSAKKSLRLRNSDIEKIRGFFDQDSLKRDEEYSSDTILGYEDNARRNAISSLIADDYPIILDAGCGNDQDFGMLLRHTQTMKRDIDSGDNEVNKSDVIIGTAVVRRTAFALDNFMKNQEEIQDIYPQSRLVIATNEPDFEEELKEFLKTHGVEGDVVTARIEKPDHAANKLWSITAGHEAIRKYVLKTNAEYLLWLDADMTADPLIISIMKKEIEGYDVVQSDYQDRSDCINCSNEIRL